LRTSPSGCPQCFRRQNGDSRGPARPAVDMAGPRLLPCPS
jgi:hypothetical protein